MEIESYKPYHIGIKLKAVNVVALKSDLRKVIEKLEDYTVVEETSASIISFSIETIASKDEVDIKFNNTANALNITGENSRAVKEVFDKVISIVTDELKYETPSLVKFYELVIGAVVHGAKDPVESLSEITDKDFNIFGQDTNASVVSIKLFTKEKMATDKEIFELVLEPYLNSPHSRYFIRVTYRAPELSKVESFHHDFENKIEKLLNLIEGE